MEDYTEDTRIFYEHDYDEYSTVYETYKVCVEPTLIEIFPHVWKLLLINLIFRFNSQIASVPKFYCDVVSTICGIVAMYSLLSQSTTYVLLFICYSYVCLVLSHRFIPKYWTHYLSAGCIIYLIASEFYLMDVDTWNESRGLHMVIAMKVISVGFDVEAGVLKGIPSSLEYAGYVFCPGNCLFGPWISLNSYNSIFKYKISLWDFKWIQEILLNVFLAILFLTVSNCWAEHFIPQSWSWFIAYQEALSIRSSQYFISYLSAVAMLTAGYGYEIGSKHKLPFWKYEVTRPASIEFPRSLVQVVIQWNIPMHTWLKNYVFRICKPMGNFFAVIMTYFMSAFLHGFNLRLAAVLLSLGFYTYVEYEFRNKLAVIFDACIKANPCKKCSHFYKRNIYVISTNTMFSLLAVFHLAYLGCLLENNLSFQDDEVATVLSKWQNLGYLSHYVTLFTFVLYKLI